MPPSGIPHHTERINDLEQWKCSLERYQTHTSIANTVGESGWGWGCHLMGMWGKSRGESEIRQIFSSLYHAYVWPQNASMQSKSISSPNAPEFMTRPWPWKCGSWTETWVRFWVLQHWLPNSHGTYMVLQGWARNTMVLPWYKSKKFGYKTIWFTGCAFKSHFNIYITI